MNDGRDVFMVEYCSFASDGNGVVLVKHGSPDVIGRNIVYAADDNLCEVGTCDWCRDVRVRVRSRVGISPREEELLFENETRKHQQEVAKIMVAFAQELLRRAMIHDASKMEDPEREVFVKVTPKLRGLTYGSEEYKAALEEMGPALQHHYQHNPHHPEFNNVNGHMIPFGNDTMRAMNLFDIVEMICDWIAATKRHADGDIGKSIQHNKDRFKIDVQLTQILANTAGELRNMEEGR